MKALMVFFLVSGLAQTALPHGDELSNVVVGRVSPHGASAGSPPLKVSVQVLFDGYTLPDGEVVHAPANFFLSPFVQTTLPLHAGDTVMIDIYADGRPLLSQKAVWHEEFNPSKNARPGEAVPFIIRPAQFFYKNIEWTNVAEGRHIVLTRAYDFRGLSAFSTAVHITVLPPLPPQRVCGTHKSIGAPRPPLKPEQVRIAHRAPRAEYEVVGTVTARAPGQWSRDAAVAELKQQAAQLGANWVILDEFHFVDPINKTNRVFIEPESHLSGKALYVASTP